MILQGDQDNHNSVDEVREYWSSVLPETPVLPVEGGGRFMTSSHAELVVEQLERLSAPA